MLVYYTAQHVLWASSTCDCSDSRIPMDTADTYCSLRVLHRRFRRFDIASDRCTAHPCSRNCMIYPIAQSKCTASWRCMGPSSESSCRSQSPITNSSSTDTQRISSNLVSHTRLTEGGGGSQNQPARGGRTTCILTVRIEAGTYHFQAHTYAGYRDLYDQTLIKVAVATRRTPVLYDALVVQVRA